MQTDSQLPGAPPGSAPLDGSAAYDATEWLFVPALRIIGIGLLLWMDWRFAAAYVCLAFAEFGNCRRREAKQQNAGVERQPGNVAPESKGSNESKQ